MVKQTSVLTTFDVNITLRTMLLLLILPCLLPVRGFSLTCGPTEEAVQGSTHTITCSNLTAHDVTWRFVADSDTSPVTVGECTVKGTCTSTDSSLYEVSRRGNQSTVQVLHVERQGTSVLGEWRCQQDMTSESCAVSEVIWPPEVNRNRCEIAFHEFRKTVDAECHIIKVFPAASCQWRYSRERYSPQIVPSAYVSETKTEFSDSDEVYYESVCKIFGMPLPTAEGEYIFTVVINPGDKRPSVAFTDTNEIKKPAKPHLLPYCTTYIDIDGTNPPPATIICPCNTSSPGSPKGLLQWIDPDGNTIRSGKSAINLLLGDVDREDPNRPYTCVVQHHTGQVNISYIPRLAYGPSRVSIDVLQQESEYKLECIVRRVMPNQT